MGLSAMEMDAIVKSGARANPQLALWGDLEGCAMINQTRKKVISIHKNIEVNCNSEVGNKIVPSSPIVLSNPTLLNKWGGNPSIIKAWTRLPSNGITSTPTAANY
jgi:hypothetical protein